MESRSYLKSRKISLDQGSLKISTTGLAIESPSTSDSRTTAHRKETKETRRVASSTEQGDETKAHQGTIDHVFGLFVSNTVSDQKVDELSGMLDEIIQDETRSGKEEKKHKKHKKKDKEDDGSGKKKKKKKKDKKEKKSKKDKGDAPKEAKKSQQDLLHSEHIKMDIENKTRSEGALIETPSKRKVESSPNSVSKRRKIHNEFHDERSNHRKRSIEEFAVDDRKRGSWIGDENERRRRVSLDHRGHSDHHSDVAYHRNDYHSDRPYHHTDHPATDQDRSMVADKHRKHSTNDSYQRSEQSISKEDRRKEDKRIELENYHHRSDRTVSRDKCRREDAELENSHHRSERFISKDQHQRDLKHTEIDRSYWSGRPVIKNERKRDDEQSEMEKSHRRSEGSISKGERQRDDRHVELEKNNHRRERSVSKDERRRDDKNIELENSYHRTEDKQVELDNGRCLERKKSAKDSTKSEHRREEHSSKKTPRKEDEKKLRSDIRDLRQRIHRLKDKRDQDILRDRKSSDHHHREKHRSKRHSKERIKVDLQIKAPLEVYDQSITPPHSSPEYDYDGYYHHPDEVKPIFEDRDIDSNYVEPVQEECRTVPSHVPSHKKPYHALPSRTGPDGYAREARIDWFKKEEPNPSDTRDMINEAAELLAQNETEIAKERVFVTVKEKTEKDQVVYDVLVREGKDGLEKLDEVKEEPKEEEKEEGEVKEEVEEEPPNLDDDIETKEKEMIEEMRDRMEKRMRMREEKERKEAQAREEEEKRIKQMQAMEEERMNLEAELQKILQLSDDQYLDEYGSAGGLRKKREYEDIEPGEVTPDESEMYEVIEEEATSKPSEVVDAAVEASVDAPKDEDDGAIDSPKEEKLEEKIHKEAHEPLPPGVDEGELAPMKVVPPPGVIEEPTSVPTEPEEHPPVEPQPIQEQTAKKKQEANSHKTKSKIIGIKISSVSAALIAQQREKEAVSSVDSPQQEEGELSESSKSEGECTPQPSKNDLKDQESSSSDSLPDSSGSISDSEDEKAKKKKKKKKKEKKKKEKRSSRRESKERRKRDKALHRSRSDERQRSRSRERDRDRYRPRENNVWSRRSSSGRSGRDDRDRDTDSDRYSSRSRSRRETRERDRHRSEKDEKFGIDKAKLRAIAIRNAAYNAKMGHGPHLDLTPEEMARLKAGGKSLGDLTDYCKRIAEKQAKRKKDGGESSSEDESHLLPSDDEDGLFIHHPFKVKEAPIIMNIRNSRQLPVLNIHEKSERSKTLRLEFPVSSGSQHRRKESEWVPVEKPSSTAQSLAQKVAPAPTKKIIPSPSASMPPPAAPPPPRPAKGGSQPLPPGVAASTPAPTQPTITGPSPAAAAAAAAASGAGLSTVGGVAVDIAKARAEEEKRAANSVFPTSKSNFSIGELVSNRLSAMRKLQENPMDMEAMNSMYKSQQQMTEWAESKQLPGQFMGSTGAQVMSHRELIGNPKNQAWAKKDVFTKAAPVSGGVGKFLLQKMGWTEGTGLGKEGTGNLEPIMLDVKMDRKGLNTMGEDKKSQRLAVMAAGTGPTAGKHPVSALMELCKRKRWGTPSFDQVMEDGPPHRKMFIFKVKVNNVEYQPNVASNNKKMAKMNAAVVCLQALGIPCQSVA